MTPPFQSCNSYPKKPKKREGAFSIKKLMLQTFAIIKGTAVMNFGKNPQHDFPKMRGPIGPFLKIHPFRYRDLSLIQNSLCILNSNEFPWAMAMPISELVARNSGEQTNSTFWKPL